MHAKLRDKKKTEHLGLSWQSSDKDFILHAEGACSIPGQGAEIPRVLQPKKQNIKEKQCCNKFREDFKNGPCQEKKFF